MENPVAVLITPNLQRPPPIHCRSWLASEGALMAAPSLPAAPDPL